MSPLQGNTTGQIEPNRGSSFKRVVIIKVMDKALDSPCHASLEPRQVSARNRRGCRKNVGRLRERVTESCPLAAPKTILSLSRTMRPCSVAILSSAVGGTPTCEQRTTQTSMQMIRMWAFACVRTCVCVLTYLCMCEVDASYTASTPSLYA